jgi:acyl-CoA reductase-like NAD-dependent aldehyde dehydrogenase
LIEKHADELAALEALNNGKSVTIAKTVDVKAAADVFRCVAITIRHLEACFHSTLAFI